MKNNQTIIGKSPALQAVMRAAELIAATDVSVLISGETGTGKGLMAQHIHARSGRAGQAWVSFDCALYPQDQIEAVLFGSSTGEIFKGFLAEAGGGTLLVENISELPLSAQAKLQNFLETGACLPVGAVQARQIDVRVLASDANDLSVAVKNGSFSSDLFYRLNVVPVKLPALRERVGDVSLLADYFFDELSAESSTVKPQISRAARQGLENAQWTGNVRELHNVCKRLSILYPGQPVDIDHLPQEVSATVVSIDSDSVFQLPLQGLKLEVLEKDLIQQALGATSGNKSRAAGLLGLTRDTFLYRLKKHHIA